MSHTFMNTGITNQSKISSLSQKHRKKVDIPLRDKWLELYQHVKMLDCNFLNTISTDETSMSKP